MFVVQFDIRGVFVFFFLLYYLFFVLHFSKYFYSLFSWSITSEEAFSLRDHNCCMKIFIVFYCCSSRCFLTFVVVYVFVLLV